MNGIAIILAAVLCNMGTIACIKKCRHVLSVGDPAWLWLLGIAVTVVTTQYLLLWADLKGISLGLAISSVIVCVMITAALLDTDTEGRLVIVSLKTISAVALAGYLLAVAGILLVGVAEHQHRDKPVAPTKSQF
jgi:hypothetical protein